MRDAGLELELAITQDRCLTRLRGTGRVERPARFSGRAEVAVWGGNGAGANMSESRAGTGYCGQVYKWRPLAELGISGDPAPPNCRVCGRRDHQGCRVTGRLVPEGKRPRWMAHHVAAAKEGGLIEISWGAGRRVRVDRDVDARRWAGSRRAGAAMIRFRAGCGVAGVGRTDMRKGMNGLRCSPAGAGARSACRDCTFSGASEAI